MTLPNDGQWDDIQTSKPKTKRETDPMLRATAKLIRLLEEMPPDVRSWAMGYAAIKFQEKERP